MIEYENLKKVNYFIYKKYSQKIQKFLISNDFILGKNVSNFEKNFAKFCKTKYCVGVNSGLDALILSLEALSLKKVPKLLLPLILI